MYVHCSRPYRVRHRKSQRDWWRRCVAGTKESMGNFTIPRTEFYRQTMRQQESSTIREMMAQQNQRQQQDRNHFNDWKFRSKQQRWSSHTNYLIYQSGLRNRHKTPKQSQEIRVLLLPRIHERIKGKRMRQAATQKTWLQQTENAENYRGVRTDQTMPYAPRPMGRMGWQYLLETSNELP